MKGFSQYKYTLVQVIREIAILEHLTEAQLEAKVPQLFVKLVDVFTADDSGHIDSVFLVLEFKEVSFTSKIDMCPKDLKKAFYSILCGLKFLHSSNIVHRDIKPANILIDKRGLCLCDFGMSRTLPASSRGKHDGNSIKVRDSCLNKVPKE